MRHVGFHRQIQRIRGKEETMSLLSRLAMITLGLVLIFSGWTEAQENKEESILELEKIVITATRTPHLLKDVPVSTTVITEKEIEQSGASTVAEALENVAGMRVTAYGSQGSLTTAHIRGSAADQVLILMDGRELNPATHGTVDLGLLPVQNIERIEVIRGPFSSLYGANALSGVINIITKPAPEKRQTEIRATYGTYETSEYTLTHGGKLGKTGYFLTAKLGDSAGDRENSGCNETHATAKLTYEVDDSSGFSLLAGYSHRDTGVPGSTTYPTPSAQEEDKRSFLDLSYHKDLKGGARLLAKTFIEQYDICYKNPEAWGGPMKDTTENLLGGVQVQYSLPWGKHLPTAGLELKQDRVKVTTIDGTSRIGGPRKLDTVSLYLQDEINPSSRLVLVPGLRYDNPSAYASQCSPRVSLLYLLGHNTRLRASYGQAFRPPTVNELYWYEDWGWGMGLFGNEDLKPEKSRGYELGLEHQFSLPLLARISWFDRKTEQLISWVEISPWHWQATNVDKAHNQGIESELRLQLTSRLSLGLNYLYQQAKDEGEEYKGNYLAYTPEYKMGLSLEYETDFGLGIRIETEKVSEQYTNRENTQKLKGYNLLNARLSQRLTKKVEVFATGENLLDESYQVFRDYPMPGRRINLGMKIGL
ncbi:TonB-dependent receptor [Candidatus Aerophobetes bacterium]|nr:TonB-dependent receptor [Candidatus Aerophobetes bacterium]